VNSLIHKGLVQILAKFSLQRERNSCLKDSAQTSNSFEEQLKQQQFFEIQSLLLAPKSLSKKCNTIKIPMLKRLYYDIHLWKDLPSAIVDQDLNFRLTFTEISNKVGISIGRMVVEAEEKATLGSEEIKAKWINALNLQIKEMVDDLIYDYGASFRTNFLSIASPLAGTGSEWINYEEILKMKQLQPGFLNGLVKEDDLEDESTNSNFEEIMLYEDLGPEAMRTLNLLEEDTPMTGAPEV